MNKKILMIFVIFLVFISIGAVSADNATDDSATDILSTADGDTSFTALDALINSGNDVIDITNDYAFDKKRDAKFTDGIVFDYDVVSTVTITLLMQKANLGFFKISIVMY